MENHVTHAAHPGDMHSPYGPDSSQAPELDDVETGPMDASGASSLDSPAGAAMEEGRLQMKPIDALRIPVGANLADVERWMIFATLQKCGGNKTRAAALLGVSLKTLYNRLNAYRAQGLTMDYEFAAGEADAGRDTDRAGRVDREGGLEREFDLDSAPDNGGGDGDAGPESDHRRRLETGRHRGNLRETQ